MPAQPSSTFSTHIFSATTVATPAYLQTPVRRSKIPVPVVSDYPRCRSVAINKTTAALYLTTVTNVQHSTNVIIHRKAVVITATPTHADNNNDEVGGDNEADNGNSARVHQTKPECCEADEEPSYDYGAVDPKSGLNGCEIAGIVIGCILIFMIVVYLGLKLLVLREAKQRLDRQRDVIDLAQHQWMYTADGRWAIPR